VFCQLRECGGEWVIRVSHVRRLVDELLPDEAPPRRALEDMLARQEVLGRYEQEVRAQGATPKRVATLEVRAVQVFVPPTGRRRSVRQKRLGFEGLEQWAVEAREVDPPKGCEPLRWILWSSRPVATFDDAWEVLSDYEQRWLVEEFHKALKTGCGVENRQHQTAKRLEVTTALCSVLAVRLVQLKTVARNAPETPADRVVPKLWLEMLRALRGKPILTVRDFYRHLAGLGGFLMRKGDGEPGWITLWRGTIALVQGIRGYLAMRKRCG
jgi:Transposase Tn5 dimerisation domain